MAFKENALSSQANALSEKEGAILKLQQDIAGFQETLSAFKIQGVLSSANSREQFKNKISLALRDDKFTARLLEFLIPRDMLELSLTSKLVNSQVRHNSGNFALIARNSMWDKENI